MLLETGTRIPHVKGARRIHAFQVYPRRLLILISIVVSYGTTDVRGEKDGPTGSGVEDEVPHSRG